MKPCNYALDQKMWLNGKYLQKKQNQKLEGKFFGQFQVFYLVSKQAYKLKQPAKCRICDVFHMLLLEQDITRKGRVNKFLELKLDADKNKKYKVKTIRDSAVYNKIVEGKLLKLYYLIYQKNY